jgi:hypothetical protein
MSEEPIDDIELEEAEPVDGSFLDGNIGERCFDPLKSKVNCAVPNGLYV